MTSSSLSLNAPNIFTGENYQIWSVKMKSYLQAYDLWEVVMEDIPLQPLPANPTLVQIKSHSDEKNKKFKAKTVIQNSVADSIFSKIIACETAKEAWEKLKKEYQGSDRVRQMQILNLKRDFESLRMQEDETIAKYSDKISLIVNKIRLLGEDFKDDRIVEKILVTIPERFESKISSLEESKDLSTISFEELISALQAQEQRRAFRQDNVTEGAFYAQNRKEKEERYWGPGIRRFKQWEVYLPDEHELLAGLPPSTMRLNFTCNDMGEYSWLIVLTTHCDAWLLSVALNSGGLGEIGRRSLFKKINNLPTIRDVVCEMAKMKVRDNKSKSNSEAGDEDEDEDEDEFEEGDEDVYPLCDACGDYASCVFWIWCDTCEKDTIRCNCNSCSPEDKCKSCKNKFAMVVRRPRRSPELVTELCI